MPPRNQSLPEGMLVAGRITGCYGVKGWVKVHPFTEAAIDLLQYPAWWLQTRDGVSPVVLDEGRVSGKGLVVHVAGVDDRDVAESLRGQTLLVRRDELPELEEEDYYWHQLENLEVWCRDPDGPEPDEVMLGRIHHLIETGANDVLVVKPCEGSIDERERLIPYLPESVVREVNLQTGKMSVDWFIDE